MSNNKQSMKNTNNKEQVADSNGVQMENNYKISEVVMWLYENHKIWIYVDGDFRPHIIKDNVDLNHKGEVNKTVLLEGKTKIQYCWDSPTEAYEAAIKYTLENLIQGGNK